MNNQEIIGTFVVRTMWGFHSRPTALLMDLANQFASTLYAAKEGCEEVNGKSFWSMFGLAWTGDSMRFRAVGEDCQELMDGIRKLFEINFGEEVWPPPSAEGSGTVR